jgi:hypothetical protein
MNAGYANQFLTAMNKFQARFALERQDANNDKARLLSQITHNPASMKFTGTS